MIKEQVIDKVCKDTYIGRYFVSEVIESLLNTISESLAKGEKVQFAGFGTFEPKVCAPRTGRNPHTNEEVKIPARIVPNFRAGKYLKNAVIKVCDDKKCSKGD